MKQLEEVKQSLENIEVSSEDSVFTLLLISDLLEDMIGKEKEINERREEVKATLNGGFKESLGVVLTKLREDEDFFNAYVANISMDVYDTFKENEISFPQLLEVSNQAAYNFMKRWTGK